MLFNEVEKERYERIRLINSNQNLYSSVFYLLSETITLEELENNKLFRNEANWKKVFKKKGIEDTIELIVNEDGAEVITGLYVPQINEISFPHPWIPLRCVSHKDFYQNPEKVKFSEELSKFKQHTFWKHLLETKFISLNSDFQLCDAQTVENYFSTFCQNDNFNLLKEFLFKGLESCHFSQFYSEPPFISHDSKLLGVQQGSTDHNMRVESEGIQGRKVEEYRDNYYYNLELIMEIKEKVADLLPENQEKYMGRVEKLLGSVNLATEQLGDSQFVQQKQSPLLTELCQLFADVVVCHPQENIFRYEIVNQYFHNFEEKTKEPLQSYILDDELDQFYCYINHLEKNKQSIEFSDYCLLRQTISRSFTNLLINHRMARSEILASLTPVYQIGIQQEINQRLTDFIEKTTDEENKFSAYSMLITKAEGAQFIEDKVSYLAKVQKDSSNVSTEAHQLVKSRTYNYEEEEGLGLSMRMER